VLWKIAPAVIFLMAWQYSLHMVLGKSNMTLINYLIDQRANIKFPPPKKK
jgi:hypothetical protein